jgi:peptidoglycan/xylan/chitin deacetylase (PgdA/CDA1 family)
MFLDVDINGNDLPYGTLCLTYDDGPGETLGGGTGPRTGEIGSFLAERGVAATFFVVGKFADGLERVLGRLKAQGHQVANHTFHHPHLLRDVKEPEGLVEQVVLADERIAPHVNSGPVFLRPPYGAWRRDARSASPVADALNRSARLSRYVGPVMWDVGGADWAYWRDGRSPGDCARDYLAQIERTGRGIVMMHDSTADVERIRDQNQALPMTTQLIPLLQERGFRFVRLDAVPQVASAVAVSYQATLCVPGGLFVSAWPRRDYQIWSDPSADGAVARWGIVGLGGGRIALRAATGRFLSVPRGACGPVLATGLVIGEWETFAFEYVDEEHVTLRTARGAHVCCDPRFGGRLTAQSSSRRGSCLFKFATDHLSAPAVSINQHATRFGAVF